MVEQNSLVMKFKEWGRKFTFPLPRDQRRQGFKPNIYIKTLRTIAEFMIFILRLNGRNRFSNELIQQLDPRIEVPLPGHQTMIFRTGHGRLLWRAKTFQQEEPMAMSWINTFLPTDCFYDIGANVGSYSLYAANKGVKTYAFEPEINNAQVLYDNIFLNNLQEQCTPMPIGLGDSTKIDTFYLKSVSKGDALHGIGKKSYLLSGNSSNQFTINVLVARLDDLVDFFGLPKPTKIKIDVDGNELNVVNGAIRTLGGVKELYIELDKTNNEHRLVFDVLSRQGFTPVKSESIATPWNMDIANWLFCKK